ncbi:MAG TPA: sulfatase [Candidatus Polarisedimenticolaceae bacterium]|nr:sulfatase [Candidatus Polarisedimenticolaceae bacterium]
MRQRGLRALAGSIAALGLAVGAAWGLLDANRCRDLENGTLWLAWYRLSSPALLGGALGAALGSLLALWPRVRRAAAGPRLVVRAGDLALGICVVLAVSSGLRTTVGSLRAAGRPSIVLVSIDTLRADRLSEMPRLQALAAEGTTCTDAMSAAPWTLPSHVSIFTSMLPFDHGVQWTSNQIARRRSMVTERLQDAGYRTAAFTGASYVSGGFGFRQGFEIYEDHDEWKEGGSHAIFGNALKWVRGMRGRPFFLFVHTYEPHFPYRHSEGVVTPRGSLPPGFTVDQVEAVYRGDLKLTEEERRYVKALYDSGVRATDGHVGAFLSTLRAEGILDDAILVVLSDHGEDLWDHVESRSPGHGHSLYQELVHVPLIFRAPGRVLAGKTLDAPVSLLDVAPTLLDLAGLPPDRHHRGRSLGPALAQGTELPPRPIFAESIEHGPDRFAWREGTLKAILAPYPDRVHYDVKLDVRSAEIFDLGSDPLERNPESGRFDPRARDAFGALLVRSRYALRPRSEREDPGAISDELRAQLRSLGYLR